ncbi:MAG: multifunctional CCA addition/repair protein [Rhodocyclaceae bacterium]|nr:multifunctional CCA addition/repair protein [Rhodocyclaceae bacterium]
MDVYCVGGAVRDQMLGLPVSDRDWVVVGSTADAMLARGFRPIGKDFPVFLHPATQDEYALARTERKTAPGYAGFHFHAAASVSLADDLLRRDLTINAMARGADGSLIDPYGGRRDLEARVLRHVSPAFAEDPVRILRVARFAARFTEFTIAPETLALMRNMVAAGEVDALVAERVWQELSRGLMEQRPSRMLRSLRDCGALARILPELDRLYGVPQPPAHHPEIDTGAHIEMVVDYAAAQNYPLGVRTAALLHDLGKGITPAELLPRHHGHEQSGADLVAAVCARLRIAAEQRDLALLAAREHGNIHRAAEARANTLVKLFERCDALRRPQRFEDLLAACACDHYGRGGPRSDYAPPALLRGALAAARSVDAGAIARECMAQERKDLIPIRVYEARVHAVRAAGLTRQDVADEA